MCGVRNTHADMRTVTNKIVLGRPESKNSLKKATN
jgi:hypothetical protein